MDMDSQNVYEQAAQEGLKYLETTCNHVRFVKNPKGEIFISTATPEASAAMHRAIRERVEFPPGDFAKVLEEIFPRVGSINYIGQREPHARNGDEIIAFFPGRRSRAQLLHASRG